MIANQENLQTIYQIHKYDCILPNISVLLVTVRQRRVVQNKRAGLQITSGQTWPLQAIS